MVDRLGQQFGNYRVLRLLGRGGFADVYLGEHQYLKTQVAIKVLQARVASAEDLESFLTEARTIAHLVHPHIVRILDFGVAEETPFLVMDYAAHGTLRQRYPKGVPVPLATLVPFVKQVAAALQYAHDEKVIHRDVKPENMLLGKNDEVLLADFGIALVAQSSRYQSTQEVTGTVAYMSPEQIQGKPRPASDQYALGIVIYEWLCGYKPFHGSFTELCAQQMFAPPPPLRERLPLLDPAVEQVLMTALAKDPKHRFSSIRAFANALEQASLAHKPVPGAQDSAESFILTEKVTPSPTPPSPMTPPPPRQTLSQNPISLIPPPPPPGYEQQARQAERGFPTEEVAQSTAVEKPTPFPWPAQQPASVQPQTPAIPQRERRPKRTLILVLACLLLIVLIVGATLSVQTYTASVAAGTATAQADLAATAIAQTKRSATATFVAANADPYPPTPGTLALYDALSQPDANWDTHSDSYGNCQFMQGAYHVNQTNQSNTFSEGCYTTASSSDFSNFVVEVQMVLTKGSCGGLELRRGNANAAYYIFWVCADQHYYFTLYGNGSSSVAKELVSSSSQAIHAGYNQSNVIAVVLNGSNFDLYVNKQKIDSASDTSNSHGTLALVASSSQSPTEAVFSNIKLWTL